VPRQTYRKRARCVACCRPAPATVHAKALVRDNLDQPTSSECLGVGLTLDLEDIEWQQNNLTDSNDGARGRVHDGLALALAKCAVEAVSVVPRKVVSYKRLSPEFVYTLQHLPPSVYRSCRMVGKWYLVSRGVSKAREE